MYNEYKCSIKNVFLRFFAVAHVYVLRNLFFSFKIYILYTYIAKCGANIFILAMEIFQNKP